MTPARFSGWPPTAIDFYRGLEADNTKAYWQAHRDVYDADVLGPMQALAAEVAEEFGPLHVFRPYRDVRFSKDKSPYKTTCAAVTEGEGGEAFYVQLSAAGLYVGAGYYHLAPDQLERYRAAVDDDATGPALDARLEEAVRSGLEVGGDALKTAPRGWPRDHPRVHLLRYKGIHVGRSFEPGAWLGTRKSLSRITGTWDRARHFTGWFSDHVGPSTEPPPEPT